MTARRRNGMRRLIDNTVDLVRSGDISPGVAAQKLLENGVPVAVIGRVLGAVEVEKKEPRRVSAAMPTEMPRRLQVLASAYA